MVEDKCCLIRVRIVEGTAGYGRLLCRCGNNVIYKGDLAATKDELPKINLGYPLVSSRITTTAVRVVSERIVCDKAQDRTVSPVHIKCTTSSRLVVIDKVLNDDAALGALQVDTGPASMGQIILNDVVFNDRIAGPNGDASTAIAPSILNSRLSVVLKNISDDLRHWEAHSRSGLIS